MSYVIKVGGSLIPAAVSGLCEVFRQVDSRDPAVLAAGGGQIADVLRGYTKQLTIDHRNLYYMALHSMDQNGILISAAGNFPTFQSISDLRNMNLNSCCVYLPTLDFLHCNTLKTYDIDKLTSDTIAVLIALRLKRDLLIVTDVDGIFDSDPGTNSTAALQARVEAASLTQPTCVDLEAAKLIGKHGLNVFVVNGNHPDRIAAFLSGKPTIGTKIETRPF